MNTRLPIIDQLIDADGDRARIDVLMQCPDAVLLKHQSTFLQAFRLFEPGAYFVLLRTNAMRAVRSSTGALPEGLAAELEALRVELVAFAAGAEIRARDGPAPLDL